MRAFMKMALLAAVLMVSESAFGAQIPIGLQIGPPPPPRVVRVVPLRPASEYVWVPGYWYPADRHYQWRDGFWVRPPYEDAVWISPRYSEGRYLVGYWSQPVARGKGHEPHGQGRGRGHNR